MQRRSMFRSNRGITLLEAVFVIIVLLIVAAIIFPVFARTGHHSPTSSCQNNMKELATAIHMYWTDYDGMLPSSALHRPQGAKIWDARASAEFCAERGVIPPPAVLKPSDIHWPQLLWPHMKNKDIIWCPSDPNRPHECFLGIIKVRPNEKTLISYIYKPAIDRAWFGMPSPLDPSNPTKDLEMAYFRTEGDFEYVSDQMIFFERVGWHWGDQNKGWSDGVSLNAAFMDGHVRNVRLKEAINKAEPKNSVELAQYLKMSGEPMYFNLLCTWAGLHKPFAMKPVNGQCCDPSIYYDGLP